MNWSSKWSNEEDTGSGPLPNDGSVTWGSKKIKSEWTTISNPETDKINEDARLFGVGFSRDGKHIPVEEIYNGEPVKPTIGIDWGTGDKSILTFLDGNKCCSIDVIIVGDLALDYDDNGWNIYHVSTLTCFSKAVPAIPCSECMRDGKKIVANCESCMDTEVSKPNEYFYSQSALLAWMKKVQENYPTSWQMLRLLTPQNYSDKATRAKEIIQKWCLSVKVEE